MYTGREFRRLPYTRLDRIAALHRGVLSRDVDRRSARRLRGVARWPAAVRRVLGGEEFGRLAGRVCASRSGAYGFDDDRAMWSPLASGPGFRGGEEELQMLLDAAARRGGGTVWLAQRAVIRVGHGSRREQLRIPPGVRLATVGLPGPRRYLRMARLARVGDSCIGGTACGQPVIALDGAAGPGGRGARLSNVWVDGRGGDDTLHGSAVQLEGGAGSAITHAKLTGSALNGGNVVGLHGSSNYRAAACSGAVLADNLITGYTTRHRVGRWADGVTVACEQARVERNAIVDASDVGIAIFGNPGTVQRSLIRENLVVSAGNNAFAGIAVDPHGVCADACTDKTTRDFRGLRIAHNDVVTGPRTAFGLGIAVGIRPLFDAPPDGIGAAVVGNGTGQAGARVTMGIAVSGMRDAMVSDNGGRWSLVTFNGCPRAVVGASVSAGLASFVSPAPAFTDVTIARCWQDKP